VFEDRAHLLGVLSMSPTLGRNPREWVRPESTQSAVDIMPFTELREGYPAQVMILMEAERPISNGLEHCPPPSPAASVGEMVSGWLACSGLHWLALACVGVPCHGWMAYNPIYHEWPCAGIKAVERLNHHVKKEAARGGSRQ
jgi:hypothetical protein